MTVHLSTVIVLHNMRLQGITKITTHEIKSSGKIRGITIHYNFHNVDKSFHVRFLGDEDPNSVLDDFIKAGGQSIRGTLLGPETFYAIIKHLFSFSEFPDKLVFTNESWMKFTESLEVINFRLMIEEFKLSDKLPLEDAINILQEHYVESVMIG